jgi:hypothetical protein
MWFSQAECLFGEVLLHGDLVEQRQDQDPQEVLKVFFSLLAHPQVPLVESGRHQLIMMASMKIIRVVAPSGGLYTAVASSSTEYGLLFAEYQDVAQHKERSRASISSS